MHYTQAFPLAGEVGCELGSRGWPHLAFRAAELHGGPGKAKADPSTIYPRLSLALM